MAGKESSNLEESWGGQHGTFSEMRKSRNSRGVGGQQTKQHFTSNPHGLCDVWSQSSSIVHL